MSTTENTSARNADADAVGPDCLSAVDFESWASKVLLRATRMRIARHLEVCDRCRRALDEWARDHERLGDLQAATDATDMTVVPHEPAAATPSGTSLPASLDSALPAPVSDEPAPAQEERQDDVSSGLLSDSFIVDTDCLAGKTKPVDFDEGTNEVAHAELPRADNGGDSVGVSSSEVLSTPTDVNQPPAAGDRDPYPQLPDFDIIREIGRGGMGIVFEAVQRSTGARRALKILPPEATWSQAVEHFQNEAKAAAQLQHPNIVQVHDFKRAGRLHYYVMQLVEGPSLGALVRAFGRHEAHTLCAQEVVDLAGVDLAGLPADVHRPGRAAPYYRLVAHWMAGVADGLAQAHKQQTWHRDIKPNNILLSPDGRAMITDFGLARMGGGQSTSNHIKGSYRYMSPEQASPGTIPIDHRADIHAIGATLYELLVYRPAFQGATDRETLSQVISMVPPRPKEIVATVPTMLEKICIRAMAKEPDSRFTSAGAMRDALRAWLAEDSRCDAAKRTTWGKPVRTAAAVVALAMIGMAVAAMMPPKPIPPPGETTTKTGPSNPTHTPKPSPEGHNDPKPTPDPTDGGRGGYVIVDFDREPGANPGDSVKTDGSVTDPPLPPGRPKIAFAIVEVGDAFGETEPGTYGGVWQQKLVNYFGKQKGWSVVHTSDKKVDGKTGLLVELAAEGVDLVVCGTVHVTRGDKEYDAEAGVDFTSYRWDVVPKLELCQIRADGSAITCIPFTERGGGNYASANIIPDALIGRLVTVHVKEICEAARDLGYGDCG